jgi:hypothetical protein
MKVEPFFVLVPIFELSTAGVLWVWGACRLWGQSDEGRGSPVDEKGRHRSSLEIIEKKI